MLEYLPKYLENRFELKINNLGSPGAGNEIVFTVPANKIWIPASLTFNFVTDANVATRQIRIESNNGTIPFVRNRLAIGPVASTTYNVSMFKGAGLTTSTINNFPIELQSLPLYEGWKIETVTASMQPGDTYNSVFFAYFEADVTQPA